MFAIEGPLSFWWWMVDDREVVELAGGLEQADVVAWGCGLCLGHSPAAAAAVVAAVADIVVGRVGIAAVVAVVVVAVAAATAIASAVAVVASDPIGPSESGLIFSSLPSQFGFSHEDHISCPETENNPTYYGPDGSGRRSTLFDRPPYSSLPSQEGVSGH
ncbi:hypothetical protein Taro_032653 [Colocasia esculenta]|uniref:Uncharacterized protein n=1 Tax=Colocasia esculenta TaxID=4460 RepID=A0A843VRV6_COLES|nr:hypothetical protein [Colocasia esculenta]